MNAVEEAEQRSINCERKTFWSGIRAVRIPAIVTTERSLAYFIIVIGAVLRLTRLDFQSLWFDEIYSVFVGAGGNFKLLFHRIQEDVHPPLYYALLGLWLSGIKQSDSSVRLLGAIISCSSLPLFWIIAQKTLPPQQRLVALLIFSTSLFQIWFAQEARAYMLAEFFALSGTLYFLGILEGRNAIISGFGYALSIALLVYVDYIAGLLPVSHGCILLYLYFRKKLPFPVICRWVKSSFLALLLFLPWMKIAFRQFVAVRSAFWTPEPSLIELLFLPVRFLNYTVYIPLIHIGGIISLLLAALFAATYIARYTKNENASLADSSLVLLWGWALLPPLLLFTAAIVSGANIFYYKPLIVSSPALYMILANICLRPRRTVVRAAMVFGVLGFCIHNFSWYYTTHTKEDWTSVMRYLRKAARPNNEMIFEGGAKLCMEYYFKRSYNEVPNFEEVSAQQVWVVKSLSPKTDEDIVEPARTSGYRLAQKARFVGVTVYRFRRLKSSGEQ